MKSLSVLAEEVRKYMEINGLKTQTALSLASGVHQPTISKLLGGKLVRMCDAVQELCDYANIKTHLEVSPEQNSVLMDALREVWDGTESDARCIAEVLKGMAGLKYRRPPRAKRGRKPALV